VANLSSINLTASDGKYWAKGTGFGTTADDQTAPTWSHEEYVKEQAANAKRVADLLEGISLFLTVSTSPELFASKSVASSPAASPMGTPTSASSSATPATPIDSTEPCTVTIPSIFSGFLTAHRNPGEDLSDSDEEPSEPKLSSPPSSTKKRGKRPSPEQISEKVKSIVCEFGSLGISTIPTEALCSFLGRPAPKTDNDYQSCLSLVYNYVKKAGREWVSEFRQLKNSREAQLFLTPAGAKQTLATSTGDYE